MDDGGCATVTGRSQDAWRMMQNNTKCQVEAKDASVRSGKDEDEAGQSNMSIRIYSLIFIATANSLVSQPGQQAKPGSYRQARKLFPSLNYNLRR